MFTILNDVENVIEIKKSGFIAYAFNVQNESDIESKLKGIRQQHPKATHVCYGYVLSSGKEKFDDDGEPVHTAGKPILDVIKKQSLQDVLIVVVRYFGGIKLGAGGLVRAYSKAASQVLLLTEKSQLKLFDIFNVTVNYEQYNLLLNEININKNIKIISSEFLESVVLKVAILKELKDEAISKLTDMLNSVNFEFAETKYFKV